MKVTEGCVTPTLWLCFSSCVKTEGVLGVGKRGTLGRELRAAIGLKVAHTGLN